MVAQCGLPDHCIFLHTMKISLSVSFWKCVSLGLLINNCIWHVLYTTQIAFKFPLAHSLYTMRFTSHTCTPIVWCYNEGGWRWLLTAIVLAYQIFAVKFASNYCNYAYIATRLHCLRCIIMLLLMGELCYSMRNGQYIYIWMWPYFREPK